jgi:hypothetical protein
VKYVVYCHVRELAIASACHVVIATTHRWPCTSAKVLIMACAEFSLATRHVDYALTHDALDVADDGPLQAACTANLTVSKALSYMD